MEYWEFLLQQEGDHHWLPLDTAQMEILEGRYRIMAHTSQPHTPVQVQVSQRLLDHDPPKRRSFKRQGQTNGDGLMVVIPFTRLQAGTWDIRCSSVLSEEASAVALADAPGIDEASPASTTWAYGVQLQVLPPGGDDDEVWTLPDEEPAFIPSATRLPQPALAQPAFAQPALDLALTAAALDAAQLDLATGDAIQGWLHRLTLSQTALLGQEGATIDITGRIVGAKQGESCQGMALAVRLVDPRTATAIALIPFPVGANTLPADLHLALMVPTGLETRLLLGELALVQATATAVSVLALQRFTLTVDLAALFDTIANQAETETDYILDFAGSSGPGQSIAGIPKDDTPPARPLDLPQGPPRSMPVLTLPRDGFNLPPRLYQPSPHEVSARQPSLPPFGTPSRRSVARGSGLSPANLDPAGVDPAIDPGTDSGTDLGIDPANLDPANLDPAGISAGISPASSDSINSDPAGVDIESVPKTATTDVVENAASFDALPSPAGDDTSAATLAAAPPISEAPTQATNPEAPREGHRPTLSLPPLPSVAPPAAEAPPPEPAAPLLPSHEVAGFRQLNLQNRFWTRLNEMAVTVQQEATQQRQASPSAPAQPPEGDAPAAAVVEPEPFAGEVVIYEDEDETLGGQAAVAEAVKDAAPEEPLSPPMPDLEVPSGELVAGEAIVLTLRVPFHPNRLYFRVWMVDPQTRSLVDEPRQVMNLRPNGHGQMEGTVQVTVPMGCLEAEFEAIAVDMVTQQESYKATVSRAIVPEGVSPAALDDLDDL